MDTEPAAIALQPAARQAFAEAYGLEWDDALGSIMRNDKALASLGVDGTTLERMWRGGVQVKLAPGTYVSRLDLAEGEKPLFTVNGFYPAMRQAFVEPEAEVRYMVCEWDEGELSWRAFRQEVIGATNPAQAVAGSARALARSRSHAHNTTAHLDLTRLRPTLAGAELLARWQELGLSSAPTQGLNGVHASAGPLEGLKERCVWAGATIDTDAFGIRLLAGGLERSTLDAWLDGNPVVTLGGETDKVFDLTEELGAGAVLEMVQPEVAPSSATSAADGGPPPAGFVWGATF